MGLLSGIVDFFDSEGKSIGEFGGNLVGGAADIGKGLVSTASHALTNPTQIPEMAYEMGAGLPGYVEEQYIDPFQEGGIAGLGRAMYEDPASYASDILFSRAGQAGLARTGRGVRNLAQGKSLFGAPLNEVGAIRLPNPGQPANMTSNRPYPTPDQPGVVEGLDPAHTLKAAEASVQRPFSPAYIDPRLNPGFTGPYQTAIGEARIMDEIQGTNTVPQEYERMNQMIAELGRHSQGPGPWYPRDPNAAPLPGGNQPLLDPRITPPAAKSIEPTPPPQNVDQMFDLPGGQQVAMPELVEAYYAAKKPAKLDPRHMDVNRSDLTPEMQQRILEDIDRRQSAGQRSLINASQPGPLTPEQARMNDLGWDLERQATAPQMAGDSMVGGHQFHPGYKAASGAGKAGTVGMTKPTSIGAQRANPLEREGYRLAESHRMGTANDAISRRFDELVAQHGEAGAVNAFMDRLAKIDDELAEMRSASRNQPDSAGPRTSADDPLYIGAGNGGIKMVGGRAIDPQATGVSQGGNIIEQIMEHPDFPPQFKRVMDLGLGRNNTPKHSLRDIEKLTGIPKTEVANILNVWGPEKMKQLATDMGMSRSASALDETMIPAGRVNPGFREAQMRLAEEAQGITEALARRRAGVGRRTNISRTRSHDVADNFTEDYPIMQPMDELNLRPISPEIAMDLEARRLQPRVTRLERQAEKTRGEVVAAKTTKDQAPKTNRRSAKVKESNRRSTAKPAESPTVEKPVMPEYRLESIDGVPYNPAAAAEELAKTPTVQTTLKNASGPELREMLERGGPEAQLANDEIVRRAANREAKGKKPLREPKAEKATSTQTNRRETKDTNRRETPAPAATGGKKITAEVFKENRNVGESRAVFNAKMAEKGFAPLTRAEWKELKPSAS